MALAVRWSNDGSIYDTADVGIDDADVGWRDGRVDGRSDTGLVGGRDARDAIGGRLLDRSTQGLDGRVNEPTPTEVPYVPTVAEYPVVVTFYVCSGAPAGYESGFCGTMANGETVHPGAVACGYAYRLGDRIRIAGDPTGRTYTCKDRGLLGWRQIDVFFWDFQTGYDWRDQLPLYPIIERVQ